MLTSIQFFLIYLLVLISVPICAQVKIELTDEERAYLAEKNSFSVHMEPNYPPFSFFKNDKFSGFSIDFADLIAERLGIRFNYNKNESWKQALSSIQKGNTDIIAQMIETSERNTFVNFTSPYIRYYSSLVVLKKNKGHLSSLEALSGKKLAIVDGYETIKIINTYYPQIEVVTFKDTKQLIDAVMLGHVAAGLSTHQVISYEITTRFINDIISIPVVNSPHLHQMEEAFAISKQHPLLRSAIQKAINALENEHRDLQRRWFGELASKNVNFSKAERQFMKVHGEIKYCIAPLWKPFEYKGKDGQHHGLSADLLDSFSQRSQTKFKFVTTQSWEESLHFLKTRRCDLLPMAVDTQQRTDYLKLTSSYISFDLVVATLNEQPYTSDFNRISDKTFAIVKGYSLLQILEPVYGNIDLTEVDSVVDGLKLVESGEVYGYIDTAGVISYNIGNHNLVGIKISNQLNEAWHVGMAVRNDMPELYTIMDKLAASVDEEESQLLKNKWMAIRYETGIDYSLFWKAIGIIVIIALFILYRYRALRLFNKEIQIAHDELAATKKELELIVSKDHLTGLANRKKLDEVIRTEFYRSDRYSTPLGIMMLDIDDFKPVNDEFGHDVGDKVLIEFSELIKSLIRHSDTVGRWGGEEFMIICPNSNKGDLLQLAEKIRKQVEQTYFDSVGKKTISIGISTWHTGITIEDFQKTADDALYIAKNQGKNRVHFMDTSN